MIIEKKISKPYKIPKGWNDYRKKNFKTIQNPEGME